MARPMLTVVGDSDRVMAEEIKRAEAAGRKLVEAVKAGGLYFALVDSDVDQSVTYCGDQLEVGALVEETGRDMKRHALGLE